MLDNRIAIAQSTPRIRPNLWVIAVCHARGFHPEDRFGGRAGARKEPIETSACSVVMCSGTPSRLIMIHEPEEIMLTTGSSTPY
jgi:hypothetical protein